MKKESNADPTMPVADDHAQASPYKSAVEELDTLRKTLRLAAQHFAKRIDMEIIRLRERVAEAGEQYTGTDSLKPKPKPRNGPRANAPGNSQLHDVRDMTILLRTLEVRPLVGRRKDLKKIESLVDELRLLIERWN